MKEIFSFLSLLILPLLGIVSSKSYPKVLSEDEERKLLESFKNGDFSARDKLIEHNLRLVAHIVKKYENSKENRDDLLSIGAIGLIKAVDSFDFDSTNKLSTYASRCIENEILMHLRKIKNKKVTTHLYAKIGEDKEGNEILLCDVLEDESINIKDKIEYDERIENIKKALKILDKREYMIIKYRYGLDDTMPLTQKELANTLNISRSYVSRIEKRALTKLYLELKSKE